MSDETTDTAPETNSLYADNAKPVFTPTGPNDAAANWEGAFGVKFAGPLKDTATAADRAVAARGPESAALVPNVDPPHVFVAPEVALDVAPGVAPEVVAPVEVTPVAVASVTDDVE